ncbi:tyrosine-type recombinase/integrase [Methylotuvimicrobium alcaliphilum]|uniref:Integrase family protein n=1 Tax=Methylotuvimicrobium alcaliphilum (strain DSM 19304 / NCIMB 14124 / VKM B-2133 / 20Z) TaxID=1091494 RepID=G4ST72_META2|nr:site-specific integrase [Methylotuvimicrobium alcaliphilum]CCE23825.1 Integrase family protein [Methylotuvimicrobium alcaliphilum 20Z]
MATIRKIENQSGIVYRAIIRDRLGKQIKSKTFKRKGDARAWADRIEADRDAIAAFGNKGARMSFAELVDEYVLQWHGKDWQHQHHVAKYWVERIGEYRIQEIDADRIRLELKNLQSGKCIIGNGRGKNAGKTKTINKTRSNTTVNRYRGILSAIFTYAFQQGYVTSNPVKKTASLPMPRGRVRYLSEGERTRLLKACLVSEWDRLYVLVLMAMTTGMRKNELMRLTWKDIDFDNGLAFLHNTKNGEPRVCPVPIHTLTELKKFRGVGSALLFPSALKPDRPFEFKKHWKKALEQAKVENFVFHSLRHDFCSSLAMHGATLAEIAELAGHKDLQTTKRYTHLSVAHKQKIAENIMAKVVQSGV